MMLRTMRNVQNVISSSRITSHLAIELKFGIGDKIPLKQPMNNVTVSEHPRFSWHLA